MTQKKKKPIFRQDPENANSGNDKGAKLIRHSISECGLGRPILIDSENTIIAGNKTSLATESSAFEKPVVVETDGRTLVVVQREDLDLKVDGKARKLAILDNRTAQVNLSWDQEVLKKAAATGGSERLGFTEDELNVLGSVSSDSLVPSKQKGERKLVKVTFGRYSFDVTQEEMSAWGSKLEAECSTSGKSWQKIITERLKL